MTQGPLRPHLLRMAAMMLVGMVVQTLYGLVDLFWVSRLGADAVAAVSVSTNLMFVSMALSQPMGVGALALVSQAFGRKEHAEVQYAFNQAQSLSLIAGAVFLMAGAALSGVYARSLGTGLTAELTVQFLAWFLPAIALQFTMISLGSALRGTGNVRPGMVAQVGSLLLNMALAPVLIFGWGTGHPFGVAGAAMATFFGTLASVLGFALYLRRPSTYLRFNLRQFRPDLPFWWRLLGIGLPSGVEFICTAVVIGVALGTLRPFGADAQAGYGIGMRLMQVGFMPAVCVSFALAAVVGQNVGARRWDRVREAMREGGRLTVGIMLVFTVVCRFAPEHVVRLFSPSLPVMAVAGSYLRFLSWVYVGSGLTFVAAGVFQGLGNTLPSLAASATRLGFFVGPVLWLSHHSGFTLNEVWLASALSICFQAVVSLWLLGREVGRRAHADGAGQAPASVSA